MCSFSLQSQNVGINTDDPKSTLDVKAFQPDDNATSNEGIIAPILTKTRVANIATPQEGTLVYVSSTTYSTGSDATKNARVAEITTKGYYYYDGTKWVGVHLTYTAGQGVSIVGNTISANVPTYVGSTSVALEGNSFQREALSGDAVASKNSNQTQVVAIRGNTIATTAPTSGQVLKWDGTAWTPSEDAGSQYTAGQGMQLGGEGHSDTEFWRWGLDRVTKNGKTGLAIIGRTEGNYGGIGSNAVDLSYSNNASTTGGATGDFSIAMGYDTTASGEKSTAMGNTTTASGQVSTAIGQETKAQGIWSLATGFKTTASGQASTAMGDGTQAQGYGSTAMGTKTTASGPHSTAMGHQTTAQAYWSLATGFSSTASGETSTAMGRETTASGKTSTAMGRETTASGETSTAMGRETTASGKTSTAMGRETTASGKTSTAMGYQTNAQGENSTAMGNGTTASGNAAVALGFNTQSSGLGSFAAGITTVAAENASTALGRGTNTTGSPNSLAIGQYNTPGSNRLFTVGNGNARIPSDIFTITTTKKVGVDISNLEQDTDIAASSARLHISRFGFRLQGVTNKTDSEIQCNRANQGTMVYVAQGTGQSYFRVCLFTGNGNSGADSSYRWYKISVTPE